MRPVRTQRPGDHDVNDIQLIKRESIPAIRTIEEGGVVHQLGELRDFNWSEPLKNFLSKGSGFSASWVQLADQEVLQPHTHPVLSMMVFYGGAGRMIGELVRPLTGDEVVVVPPGCLHGFIGGKPGLYGLSIQFAQGLYSIPEKPRVVFARADQSLEELVEFSEERAAAFAEKSTLASLDAATLEHAPRRQACIGALSTWLTGIEAAVVSRYATCSDPTFQAVFRERLLELVQAGTSRGRDSSRPGARRDAKLEAITNWFCYQMYVLDNAEKAAIVCLVLDKAKAILRKRLEPVLGKPLTEDTFGPALPQAEARAALALLAHATPAMYARWKALISEAWGMADAMVDRLAAVTLGAPA